MSFKFENLIIWQKAMDLGEDIAKIADNLPKKEVFNLSSQARRAADSVALNISEGSILQSDKEYRKFLGYSIRSTAEFVTCLHSSRNIMCASIILTKDNFLIFLIIFCLMVLRSEMQY